MAGGVSTENLVRLILLFAIVLLLLFSLHNLILLRASREQVVRGLEKRMALLGEEVVAEIKAHEKEAFEGPYYLNLLATKREVERLALLDREERIIIDSSGGVKAGERDRVLGIMASDFDKAWEGKVVLSHSYRDDKGKRVKSIFLPVVEAGEASTVLGVLRLTTDLTPFEKSAEGETTFLLLMLFGVLGGGLILYYVLRGLFIAQREAARPSSRSAEELLGREGPDKQQFLMETFNSLIKDLKEKEQVLELLRSLAEERAEKSESYNENILRSVGSGVITFNCEKVITTMNQAAGRILGVTEAETVGKTCMEVFGDGSQIPCLVEMALTREEVAQREECQWVKRDGERVWVGMSTSLLRDEEKMIGVTCVLTDLTEIKRLQEQVEMKRRLTLLGEMSAGIAHEFRNFMGTILGYARLLDKKMEEGDTRKGTIASMIDELHAMGRVIDDLLRLGKADQELNLYPANLAEILNSLAVSAVAGPGVSGPRPKVVLDLPATLPQVWVDEVLIRQAFSNIIQNAVEAMPWGGEVRISARLKEKTPRPEVSHPQSHDQEEDIEVLISDTGIGIPQDKLEKIFLPFFTTKEKGTGLGLTLVHKIIVSHNGRITVESRGGKGTTFHIFLPVKSPHPPFAKGGRGDL